MIYGVFGSGGCIKKAFWHIVKPICRMGKPIYRMVNMRCLAGKPIYRTANATCHKAEGFYKKQWHTVFHCYLLFVLSFIF
jgi:hypothetical protein